MLRLVGELDTHGDTHGPIRAASGCKTLAASNQALRSSRAVSMLKQLVLYSTAFAASAFAPTQRLVGRAFGASAGKNLCESIAFCSP